MGYTTEFSGHFEITPFLKPIHRDYLRAFAYTRRMKRNTKVSALPDPLRQAVGLPCGPEGGYYVGSYTDENFGQTKDDSIIDYNYPPNGQPDLWCQWEPDEYGIYYEWNGMEKFYGYVPWLKYLIDHFLSLWEYKLNGEVLWQGEDITDRGLITVIDNKVGTQNLR